MNANPTPVSVAKGIKIDRRERRPIAVPLLLLLTVSFPAPALAQVAPPPGLASAAPIKEVIELSPFVVNSDKDVGFAAATSLAGGRLALDLNDTPVSYSVLTREFIDALNITNLEAAAQWTPNTTEVLNSSGHGGTDDIYGQPLNYSVRGAGVSGFAMTKPSRNFFVYAAVNDSYAVERYDFGRGPNSVLFGNASLGGMSSTTTKQARLDRSFGTLGWTVGAWGNNRLTLDANQPLGKNVSLRLAGVNSYREGWRDRQFEETRALFLTTTFKLARNTTVRVEGERGRWGRSLSSPNIRDFLSGWDGVTTFDGPVTTLPTDANARGITRLAAGPIYYPFSPVNAVMNYQNQATTLSGGVNNQVPIAGFVQGSLPSFNTNGSVMTYAFNIPPNRFAKAVAGSTFRVPPDSFSMSSDTAMIAQDFDDVQITIDHKIGPVYLQLAADKNHVYQKGHMLEARGAADIYIDINKRLPEGTPNPHFLDPYSDATLRENMVWHHAKGIRFAAGMPLDARQWGKYMFSVQGGVNDTFDSQQVYVLSLAQNADHRVWGTAAPELIRRRSYLSDSTRPYPIEQLKTVRYIDPVTNVDKTVRPIWAMENNRPDSNTRTDTRFQYAVASMNARFWQERIIVLGAARVDKFNSYTEQSILQGDYPADWPGTYPIYKSLTSPGWAKLTYIPKDASSLALGPAIPADARPRAANGDRLPQYAKDVFKDDTNAPEIDRRKVTRTVGTILRPLSWASVYANYSETFNPPMALQRIDTSFVDPSVVKGVDLGLRFALIKDRLNFNVTYYTNKEINALVGQSISGNVNAILAANAVGDTSPAGINKRGVELLPGFTDLRDREAQGYEGELTANIAKGWRMMANFGIPKAYETNAQRDSRVYLEKNMPGILKQIAIDAGVLIDANNVATVEASIPVNARSPDVNNAVNGWNNLIAAQKNFIPGRRIIQNQPNANLFTDYTFQTGRLQGLRAGGGVQWRQSPIIGYRGADTIVNPANPAQAIDDPTVDALTPVYGLRNTINVVATLGYTLKLPERHQLVIDLRVNNVLDRRGPMWAATGLRPKNNDYTSPARVTTPTFFALLDPVSYNLSATLKF